MTTKKRKGQHHVKAVIRVYSKEGSAALESLAKGNTTVKALTPFGEDGTYMLYEVNWRPRPSINEWNTESDWRKTIARTMQGLYFDVLVFEWSWKLVEA